jgi:hypothetical protein
VADDLLRALQREYARTHGADAPPPRQLRILRAGDPSDPLCELGGLVSITYETLKTRGEAANELAHYVHTFVRRPVLSYTPDGLLVITGGSYTITKHGIEG